MNTRGWDDIAYNAVVCPHGFVFEGRWKGRRSAAQGTNDGNDHYYAICFLGGIDNPFTAAGKQGFLDARATLGGGSEVHPHSYYHATSCPGDEIRNWIAAGLPVEGSPSAPPPLPSPAPPHPVPPVPQPPAPPTVNIYNLAIDGNFGPATVRALQTDLNRTGANPKLAVDGNYGPATKKALQARLNATNGPVAIDGNVGPQTIKALQRHVGAGADGVWGADTTRKLQATLNAGKF
jgi:hypothetical protein